MTPLPPSFQRIGKDWNRLDVNCITGFLLLIISAILFDLWVAVTTGKIAEHKRGHSGGYSFEREPGDFLYEFAKDILILAFLVYGLRFVLRKGRALREQRRSSEGQPDAALEPPSD